MLKKNPLLSSHYFPNNSFSKYVPLEILEEMLSRTVSKPNFSLKNTGIVYIHHALQTSINLVDAMIRLGASPQNIFVLGKKYSECPAVVNTVKNYGVYYHPCSEQIGLGQFSNSFTRDINWLWKQVSVSLKKDIRNILVLDHGGYASSFIPLPILQQYNVVAVEKTTAGLLKLNEQGLPPFPVISMASSAVKKILESPLIAAAIVNKLLPLIPKRRDVVCGVIGYGAIGKALTTKLLSIGYKVILYDCRDLTVSSEIICFKSFSKFIDSSDYIFGCTGQSTIEDAKSILLSKKDKVFISCSSEDKEFVSLLRAIQKERKIETNPLDEVQYITKKGSTIRILRGGFPINFDNSEESVPRKDIQLTRALVLSSTLQATQFFNDHSLLNKAGIYTLEPVMQHFIATQWFKAHDKNCFPKHIINNFQNIEWILNNSEGIYHPCPALNCINGSNSKFSITAIR